MNWDAISAIGELIGAVAVVITLLYVAVQIKQNTEFLSAQTAYNYFKARDDKLMLQASDPILGSIAIKARLGEELSRDEKARLDIFITSVIFTWEYEWSEFEAGRYSFEQLNVQNKKLDFYNSSVGTRNLWEQMKPRLKPTFNKFVEDHLV